MLSAKLHISEHSLVCKLNNSVTFTKCRNLSTKAFFFKKILYIAVDKTKKYFLLLSIRLRSN